MGLRLLTAVIGLPLLAAVVWLGGVVLTAFGLLVTLVAVREFLGLARAGGARRQGPLPYFASAAVLLAGAAHSTSIMLATLAAAVMVALTWAVATWDGESGDTSWLWTVGAVLYLPVLLSHYLWLRALPDGLGWVAVALAGTFASDTGAYLTGRAVGRHRMAPRISPGKTWEGAAGGLAGGVLGVWGAATLAGLPAGAAAAGLGACVSVVAQAGDLAESYLKRSARVKDAGTIVPGHGGLLDRLDSLVFTGPFVYYYAVWVMGAGTP